MGEFIRQGGEDYFNPDEFTRSLIARNPGLSTRRANEIAWETGKRGLEEAISNRTSFAFETTLGGKTISGLLHRAAGAGLTRIWYVALDSADAHIARVKARVARGGHDIPESRIRERYDNSRANLSRLVPKVFELKVFDNSYRADVDRSELPKPKLVLDYIDGRIKNREGLIDTPDWAKPIVAAALQAERQ